MHMDILFYREVFLGPQQLEIAIGYVIMEQTIVQ